jgi:hypothetical protein
MECPWAFGPPMKMKMGAICDRVTRGGERERSLPLWIS